MSDSSNSGGPGLVTLLTVLFVGLKLTHIIDWSWWMVFAPVWASAIFAILVLIGVGIFVWRK